MMVSISCTVHKAGKNTIVLRVDAPDSTWSRLFEKYPDGSTVNIRLCLNDRTVLETVGTVKYYKFAGRRRPFIIVRKSGSVKVRAGECVIVDVFDSKFEQYSNYVRRLLSSAR